MIVAVPKETFPGENRVALMPANVPALLKAGIEIVVESGAGASALQQDVAYVSQGAAVEDDRTRLLSRADVLLMVRGPGADTNFPQSDLNALRPGAALIAFLEPLAEPDLMKSLAGRNLTLFAMDLIPRVTRAQQMDTLSSMAMLAGYKAVLLAAQAAPRMFPLMMTAAGTFTPAKVFVIGAGVAGLQAIATARQLGAVVEAYDLRPAVKEQVESLGARFVELDLKTDEAETSGGYARQQTDDFYRVQRELLSQHLAKSDVVITTAAVPGKRAPVLISRDIFENLRPGSVVVDLAAEKGGNCSLTKPGEQILVDGVTVIGPVNLPSEVPLHASQMYSKNISTFLQFLLQDGALNVDTSDEIIRESLVAHGGRLVNAAVLKALKGE